MKGTPDEAQKSVLLKRFPLVHSDLIPYASNMMNAYTLGLYGKLLITLEEFSQSSHFKKMFTPTGETIKVQICEVLKRSELKGLTTSFPFRIKQYITGTCVDPDTYAKPYYNEGTTDFKYQHSEPSKTLIKLLKGTSYSRDGKIMVVAPIIEYIITLTVKHVFAPLHLLNCTGEDFTKEEEEANKCAKIINKMEIMIPVFKSTFITNFGTVWSPLLYNGPLCVVNTKEFSDDLNTKIAAFARSKKSKIKSSFFSKQLASLEAKSEAFDKIDEMI